MDPRHAVPQFGSNDIGTPDDLIPELILDQLGDVYVCLCFR